MNDRRWMVEVVVPGTRTVLYRTQAMSKGASWREGARLQKRGYDARFVEVEQRGEVWVVVK